MRDLSLHLMDIIQNSLNAGAGRILVDIIANPEQDDLTIRITDNGCGMSELFLRSAADPFVTSRKTRSVGLGIPLFKEHCELTGGTFELASKVGQGTILTARFGLNHIDRMPLGSISETLTTLVLSDPATDYVLTLCSPEGEFSLDWADLRARLEDVPLNVPDVLAWIKASIDEQQQLIFGGVLHEITR